MRRTEFCARARRRIAEAAALEPGTMASVSLRNIKKIYPHASDSKKVKKKETEENPENRPNLQITEQGVVAVQDFNLEVADKEFIVLVGPSGCGKSTTLRMIAGLEEITEGELYIGERLINDVPPKDRDIAMVFQNYALYPHMTVYENMAFALNLRKTPKAEIERKVREAAEILGITELLNRKPKALSGGQRQRVAIGRAIVREPKVFLLDEPLSNLDAKLRNQMRAELIKLRKRIDTTFVYVTHDQIEAMTLGDRIVIMRDGFIMQIGTPQEVFNRPANLFVAGFIGMPSMNLLEGRCEVVDGRPMLRGAGFAFPLRGSVSPDRELVAGVRPQSMRLAEGPGMLGLQVDVVEYLGTESLLVGRLAGGGEGRITAVLPGQAGEQMKRTVALEIDLAALHVFDRKTGLRVDI